MSSRIEVYRTKMLDSGRIRRKHSLNQTRIGRIFAHEQFLRGSKKVLSAEQRREYSALGLTLHKEKQRYRAIEKAEGLLNGHVYLKDPSSLISELEYLNL